MAAPPAVSAARRTAPPALPDWLAAARERKGVDLFRAERDTKIRARYLAALERGDYRELPGAVYTKGFLRNYAIYLGLDPEEVLRQWRRERGDQAPTEPVMVAPKAILEAPRPLTFSPSIVVAALMTFGVILFGAYLAVQLLRFAKPPTLEVRQPGDRDLRCRRVGDDVPAGGHGHGGSHRHRRGARAVAAVPGHGPAPMARGAWTSTSAAGRTSSTSMPWTPRRASRRRRPGASSSTSRTS